MAAPCGPQHHRCPDRLDRAGRRHPAVRHRAPRRRVRELGLAVLRRCDHTDGPAGRPPHRCDVGGGHFSQPPDPDLLCWVHGGRSRVCPVFRLHVPFHRFDAGADALQQHRAALRLLGTGRRVVIPADRVLARAAIGCCRGQEGVHHHPHRRRGLPDRDPLPVPQGRRLCGGGAQCLSHTRHLAGGSACCRRRGGAGRSRPDLDGAGHLCRSRGQVGAVPAACLAAGRHGGSDPSERVDSRRHDGCCGRVPGGPVLPGLPAIGFGNGGGGSHRARSPR